MSDFFGPYPTPEGPCPDEANSNQVIREAAQNDGIIESSIDLHTHKYPSSAHPGTRQIFIKMVRTVKWITFARYEEVNPPTSLPNGAIIPMPSVGGEGGTQNFAFASGPPPAANQGPAADGAAANDAADHQAAQAAIPANATLVPTVDMAIPLTHAAGQAEPRGPAVNASIANSPHPAAEAAGSQLQVAVDDTEPLQSPPSPITIADSDSDGMEAGSSNSDQPNDGGSSSSSDDYFPKSSYGPSFKRSFGASAVVKELAAYNMRALTAQGQPVPDLGSDEEVVNLAHASSLCTNITNSVSRLVDSAAQVHREASASLDAMAEVFDQRAINPGQNYATRARAYSVVVEDSTDSELPELPSQKAATPARPIRKSTRIKAQTNAAAGPSTLPANNRRGAPASSSAKGKGKGKGKARAEK